MTKIESNGNQYEKVEAGEQDASLKGLGFRHAQTLLLFVGLLLTYMIRINMSLAIVDMTDPHRETHFKWDMVVQSLILSSFFWGYIVMQIPAGALAARFGGKVLIALSMFINSGLSLLVPLAATLGGWKLVCGCRLLQGVAQAVVYPSMHHIISQWIPKEEKSLLCSIIFAGSPLGVAVQLLTSGFLASRFGWESIFYSNGALGVIWMSFYVVFGASSPEKTRFISEAELKAIQKSLGRSGHQKRYATPWRQIFTSLPFWAVIVAHSGQSWGFNVLATEMPTYMAKVLSVDLKTNGMFSSLPYLTMYAVSCVTGTLADFIVGKRWFSVTNTRKLFNTIGFWGPCVALIALSYCPDGNVVFAVGLLTLSVGINAAQYNGFMINHIDLAPNFSAVLMGITNCAGTISSILGPIVCGLMVNDEKDVVEWRKVFFLSAAVFFFSNAFFLKFGTARLQSWNQPEEKTDIEMATSIPLVAPDETKNEKKTCS